MSAWPLALLGDVCDILDRFRKPITKSGREAGPYPYYGATGIVDRVNGYIFDEPLVLLGEDGAKWGAGDASAFGVSGRCWVNNHAHVLRPDRRRLIDDWLIYFLNMADLMPFITGVTVPKLNQEKMRDIKIPLPPLAEQRRIVATLDEAFEGIAAAMANAEKNLANARELASAFIREVLGQPDTSWTERPFEECLQPVKYAAKVQRKDFKKEGAYPIISQEADFINGYWDHESDVFRVDAPVIIFGDHTQVLKYVDFDFVLGADGVKILKPKTFLKAKFLMYSIKAAPLDKLGYARHYRILKQRTLRFPPLAEQNALCEKADRLTGETQKLEKLFVSKMELLAELKQSILHRAFNGDLTPAEALAA